MIDVIFAIIWGFTKVGLISAGSILLISIVLLLLHPIVIDGKVRASITGQKVYIKVNYLFNMLGLEFQGSKYSQKVFLRILWVRKILKEEKRIKDKKTPPPKNDSQYGVNNDDKSFDADSENTIKNYDDSSAEDLNAENLGVESETNLTDKVGSTGFETESDVSYTDRELVKNDTVKKDGCILSAETDCIEAKDESNLVIPSDKKTSDNNKCDATDSIQSIGENSLDKKYSDKEECDLPKTFLDPKQNGNVLDKEHYEDFARSNSENENHQNSVKGDKKEKNGANGTSKKNFDLRVFLRNIKKQANDKITKGRKKIKLFLLKWKQFSPALKRLWRRGKKAISVNNVTILLRYALQMPHLTGMFHGVIAIFSELAQRINVKFLPIPVFTSPTFYSRTNLRIVIRPFFLFFAICGLFFEFALYKDYFYLLKLFIKEMKNK